MSQHDEPDPPPSDEEQAEAAALARALEGEGGAAGDGPGAEKVPEEALATAALLRQAHPAESAAGAGEVGARVAAAAARVLPSVDARRPRVRWRWLVPTLLAPSVAVAVAIFWTAREGRQAPIAHAVPPPSLALLETQARAARGREPLGTLDREMRGYRSAFYAALAADEPSPRRGEGR